MPSKIEYQPDLATVLIENLTTVTAAEARLMTEETIRLLKEHKAARILCDCSQLQLQMSVDDLHRLVEFYQQAGMPMGTRIALVLSNPDHEKQKLEIFGIAALNRGYSVRLFSDKHHAGRWLQPEGNS